MDGVTGGYPDRREDEQPGIAPVDAGGGAAVDQVAPVVEPTVQSTVPVERPDTAADPVTSAPVVAPASKPLPARPQGLMGASHEAALRRRADENRRRAVEDAKRRGGEAADALRIAEAHEPSRTFGIEMEDILPDIKQYNDARQDRKFNEQPWYQKDWNEVKRLYYRVASGVNATNAMRALEELHSLDAIEAKVERGELLHPPEKLTWQNREQLRAKLNKTLDSSILSASDMRAKLAGLPLRPSTRRFNEAVDGEDFFDVIKAFGDAPMATYGDKLLQSGPNLIATGIGGMAAGPPGAAALGSAASFSQEGLSSILEDVKDKNGNPIDVTDPQALRAALQDPAVRAQLREKALVNGTKAAVVDLATGGIGSKTLTTASSPLKKMVANNLAQFAAQGSVNVAGEIVTSLALEGKLPSWGKVAGALIDTGSGMLTDAAISGGKSAIGAIATAGQPGKISHSQRINGLIGHAEQAQQSAATLAASIKRVQGSNQMASDPDAMKAALDSFGAGDKLYIPEEVARGWIRDGKVDDDFLVRTGIAAQLNSRKQDSDSAQFDPGIEIDKSALATARLRPDVIDEVARNIRMSPRGMTANEANAFLQDRQANLKKLADQMEVGKTADTDGKLVYRRAFQEARNKGLDHDAARIEAARETERVLIRVNENVERTGISESADELFLRERYRQAQPRRDLAPEAAREAEDGYVYAEMTRLGKRTRLRYERPEIAKHGGGSGQQP
jgi:hypothetical protein